MATTGATNPSTAAVDATVGTISWTSIDYIKSDVAQTSYIDVSNSGQTRYAKGTNYGFSIPAGATINGITVRISRSRYDEGTCSAVDAAVKIVKSDGNIGTTNKAVGGEYPTSNTVQVYGSDSDLWGEIWSASDINDADFGVVLSTTVTTGGGEYVRIKNFTIDVDYTEKIETDIGHNLYVY